MAGNTQMNENERGLFSFQHGIVGMLIATALLLSILAFLTVNAIAVQKANATNYYKVNQDLHVLKMNSPENYKQRTNVKGE
jgi:hypothetical protein